MSFNIEWNESAPLNSESASAGASRIRTFKEGVRERLAIDHNHKADETDDADIGKHKQVSLIEKAEAPATPTAGLVIYDKVGVLKYKDTLGAEKGVVNDTGDQTVAGVKTFSSIPVLPASDPTTDNQAARKVYIDTEIAAAIAALGSFAPESVDGDTVSVTMPNGLIIKWGTRSSASANVTFPVAFPAACLFIITSPHANSTNAAQMRCLSVETSSKTGFSLYAAPVSGMSTKWLAIGY